MLEWTVDRVHESRQMEKQDRKWIGLLVSTRGRCLGNLSGVLKAKSKSALMCPAAAPDGFSAVCGEVSLQNLHSLGRVKHANCCSEMLMCILRCSQEEMLSLTLDGRPS